MTSQILVEVEDILRQIRANGISINGTREIQNVSAVFNPTFMNLELEESLIKDYYNYFVEDYDVRLALEKDHYNFLKAFLIHKVKEVQYFFKLDKDDYSSRKNVIWSNDCVSSIQFLRRPEKNILTVIIRSSDTIRLLPIDFLYMIKLLGQVLDRYNLEKYPNDEVRFLIVSSHYYLKDQEIVDKILG